MAFPITNGNEDKTDGWVLVAMKCRSDVTRRHAAFTLIELLVTLSIIALLLVLAVPRYFGRVELAKEVALRENLHQMRDALDKYYGDNSRYPDTLQDLATRKYLRRIPVDPMTDSERTWIVIPPPDLKKGGVFDVRSGAPGNGKDGTPYRSW